LQGRNHRARYRQIADALARHGLGYFVGLVGLERLVPFHRGLLGHPQRPEPYTMPEHVRMAIEDLGNPGFRIIQCVIRTMHKRLRIMNVVCAWVISSCVRPAVMIKRKPVTRFVPGYLNQVKAARSEIIRNFGLTELTPATAS
jgi:hypothetical protein